MDLENRPPYSIWSRLIDDDIVQEFDNKLNLGYLELIIILIVAQYLKKSLTSRTVIRCFKCWI